MKTTDTARAGRKAGQGSKWIRPTKRLAIYLRDGLCCAYCGATVEDGATLSLDHITACELGGHNGATNLVTCCISCNSSKRDLTTRAWVSVLRTRGVDTSTMGARIRRSTRKNLAPHIASAKTIITDRPAV